MSIPAYQLHQGDCRDVMATLPEQSIDSIITDPPYGLEFMGKDWDHGVPGVEFWKAALRVAKPGAFLLAFGGTRTFHRLACAIEDAGWEIRDTIMYVYGSGFPKSHSISKAIDKMAGAERFDLGPNIRRGDGKPYPTNVSPDAVLGGGIVKQQTKGRITAPATPAAQLWDGWGTALKPAWEPVIVAMKPIPTTFAENALEHGVAGLWIDGARVETDGERIVFQHTNKTSRSAGIKGNISSSRDGQTWENTQGRWPANLIHDGNDEVLALFPGARSSGEYTKGAKGIGDKTGPASIQIDGLTSSSYSDTGSAARFFYTAKASRAERNAGLEGMPEAKRDNGRNADQPSMNGGEGNPYNRGAKPVTNHHPTVKPLALMEYLCKLTRTPTGGVVLDPFMGSGTTGMACMLTGRDFIGIDLNPEYVDIAKARIDWAIGEARARLELDKLAAWQNGIQADTPVDLGPLFGAVKDA